MLIPMQQVIYDSSLPKFPNLLGSVVVIIQTHDLYRLTYGPEGGLHALHCTNLCLSLEPLLFTLATKLLLLLSGLRLL